METRRFKKNTMLKNVQAYSDKFGHMPAPEAFKFLSSKEIEHQAAEAIAKNEPVSDWACRSKTKLGTSLDGFVP